MAKTTNPDSMPDDGLPDVPELWAAKRKVAVIMEILKGSITIAEACRRYDVTQGEYQDLVERFMQAGENGLKAIVVIPLKSGLRLL